MAMNWFLNLDTIKGESADRAHPDELDVQSWSWGMSSSGGPAQGGGAGAGKTEVRDMTVTTWLSRATPELLLACTSGRHLPRAVLSGRKAGGQPHDLLVITMSDVVVTSVDLTGSESDEHPTHHFTVSFAKVDVAYRRQRTDGKPDAPVTATWDARGARPGR